MTALVAVPGRLVEAVKGVRTEPVAAGRGYLEAVRRAGGEGAVLLPGRGVDWREVLRRFDGLLLHGGGDIDPVHYGAESEGSLVGVVAAHDETELAAVRAALDLGLPILAVCRGLQVLNVVLGGTLHQHVDGHLKLRHEVDVRPGTRLDEAMAERRPTVHSVHHQALDRLGTGLEVTATSDDGVVEACELVGPSWVVGVQWHPEDTAAHDPPNQRLFDAFVAACRPASGPPGP